MSLDILILERSRLILCIGKYADILSVVSLRKTFSKRKKSVSFRTQTCSLGGANLEVLRLIPKPFAYQETQVFVQHKLNQLPVGTHTHCISLPRLL